MRNIKLNKSLPRILLQITCHLKFFFNWIKVFLIELKWRKTAIKCTEDIGSRAFLERSHTSTREEKVHNFRDTLYMAGRRGYVSQLNIRMRDTRLYNCSDIRGTNATHTRIHAMRVRLQFSSTRIERTKVWIPMSRQADLDIIFFRARNRIISRNGLSSSASLLEKSILFYLLYTRNRVFAIVFLWHVSMLLNTGIREKSFYIYNVYQL